MVDFCQKLNILKVPYHKNFFVLFIDIKGEAE